MVTRKSTKKTIRQLDRSGTFEKEQVKITYNDEQRQAIELINKRPITIITGRQGTGKTSTAVHRALQLLDEQTNTFNKIIITRPAVATEQLGFLPGDLSEKYDVYLQPFVEFFAKFGKYNGFTMQKFLDDKKLEKVPLAFMRGLNLDNAIVLFDEAQNATEEQMKLIVTRISKTSKLIITGDTGQKDIKGFSGLQKMIDLSKKEALKEIIGLAELVKNERNPIITTLLDNWDI